MKKELKKPRTVGVIDIGSSAIRMVVMEIRPDGTFHRLDRASKPIQLGRDVFVKRVLGRETIMQAIKILAGFNELLHGWSIAPTDIFVIATSAIREARNRDTFIDRVFIRTGLRIRIVDGVEENHLTYIAVLHAVGELQVAFARTASIIMEVGGGSTELMIMDRGKMVAAHLFRLGTLRLDHHSVQHSGEGNSDLPMEDQFRSTIEGMRSEFNLSRIKYYVMVGGDARTAAAHCGTKRGEHYSVISRENFSAFLEKICAWGPDRCVRDLNITYYESESLIPALKAHQLFLAETSADEIIVPDVSIREGVLLRFALGYDEKTQKQYEAQVLASALSLGRKFHFDEDHAIHVSKLTEALYDSFVKEHGMGRRERLYLQVAGMLHDIGYFVRATGHHKHGAYLVANSEIFGLGVEDVLIISQIIRYHRSARPVMEHLEYASLSQEGRLTVIKCAAMLRVVDALDRSHTQRMKQVEFSIDDEIMIIQTSYQGDLSVERRALEQKGELFEDVFGFRLVVR